MDIGFVFLATKAIGESGAQMPAAALRLETKPVRAGLRDAFGDGEAYVCPPPAVCMSRTHMLDTHIERGWGDVLGPPGAPWLGAWLAC